MESKQEMHFHTNWSITQEQWEKCVFKQPVFIQIWPQVCDQSTLLNDLEVVLQDGSKMRLEQMKSDDGYTVLLSGLPVTTPIFPAGAVIGHSENQELINYVQFSAAPGEVNKIYNIYLHENVSFSYS